MFTLIAFDADDTLWENEILYREAQEKLRRLLAPYASADEVDRVLYEAEMRNMEPFGYGIKAFTLSMIETAVEIGDGRISAAEVGQVVGFGRAMTQAPVCLLPHVAETIPRLATRCPLMLLTKGDPLDQQRKIRRSGIGQYFQIVEVVAEKDEETYAALLARYRVEAAHFMMVGNSLRSDILPVLALGGHAVYIPHALTWSHEHAEEPDPAQERYHRLEHIGLLPTLLERYGCCEGR